MSVRDISGLEGRAKIFQVLKQEIKSVPSSQFYVLVQLPVLYVGLGQRDLSKLCPLCQRYLSPILAPLMSPEIWHPRGLLHLTSWKGWL